MRVLKMALVSVLGMFSLQEEIYAQPIAKNAESAGIQEAFNERFLKSNERAVAVQICVTVDEKEGKRLDSLPQNIGKLVQRIVEEKHTVQAIGVVIRSNHCFAVVFESKITAERAVELSRKLMALDFVTNSSPVGHTKINVIFTNVADLAIR